MTTKIKGTLRSVYIKWELNPEKTFGNLNHKTQTKFRGENSPNLSANLFDLVANRKRSSWTGGVNSTHQLERKINAARIWREAVTV